MGQTQTHYSLLSLLAFKAASSVWDLKKGTCSFICYIPLQLPQSSSKSYFCPTSIILPLPLDRHGQNSPVSNLSAAHSHAATDAPRSLFRQDCNSLQKSAEKKTGRFLLTSENFAFCKSNFNFKFLHLKSIINIQLTLTKTGSCL